MYKFFIQVQSDKIKLQLLVEDLQHKYEPKGNNATINTGMKVVIMKQRDIPVIFTFRVH